MQRLSLLVALVVLTLATPADAHPHVWATMHNKVIFGADGKITGARVAWTFDKAYTAVLWQMPTGEFMQSTQPGGVDWGFNTTTGGRVVVYAGGLPIFAGGELVGGLGVSGGTGEQDEACARAALAAEGLE